MKVLIYSNKAKDFAGACETELIKYLDKYNVQNQVLTDDLIYAKFDANAIFAIGGDGTILFLAEFASKNNIPIIGINAGNLGFLCEFEKAELEDAVIQLVNGNLNRDVRTMLSVSYNQTTYYALNEVYVQRTYNKLEGNTIAEIEIEIDNSFISHYKGDGTIISSPTGATAYSFSLGGPILSPYSNVFAMTPIAAHSLNQRPIVYSDNSKCNIKVKGKAQVGVFVDGRLVEYLNANDCLQVQKADNNVVFLRKKDYNFFKKLSKKLKKTLGEDEND